VACHLAQANVSRLRFPPDDPRSAEVMAATDRINRLAERAPGFVWRTRTPFGEDDRLIVNVSVWATYESLHRYTYQSAHNHYVRRQRQWFEPVAKPSTVLWWLPAGTVPTVEEALARLRHLRTYGPGPSAFSLRVRFDPRGNREPTPAGRRPDR
jgi:heme-degrading monooxygenase HmoA